MTAAATALRTAYVPDAASPLGRLLKKRLRGWRIAPKPPRGPFDAVVHFDYDFAPRPSEEAFSRNVLGTMKALAAGVEAGAKTIVLVSSTMVYGARPRNPHFMLEDRRVRLKHATPYVKDLAEVEQYAADYLKATTARLVLLRFAHLAGPTIDSPLMRYLAMKAPPVPLGFDAPLQLLHEEDAADALVHALSTEAAGPVNVAADGIVPVLLLLRRLRKAYVPVFHPLLASARRLAPLPLDPAYLMFPCGGDTSRMKGEFGFAPKRSIDDIVTQLAKRRKR